MLVCPFWLVFDIGTGKGYDLMTTHPQAIATTPRDFDYVPDLDHVLEPALGERLRLGLIVLASDSSIEHEWRDIMGRVPGVALYQTRIAFDPHVTADSLRGMEAGLADCASRFVPGVPFDVIAYGCTSAGMLIGSDAVERQVRSARPEVSVTDPFRASIAALKHLESRRIALITPYSEDINRSMRTSFINAGFEVPVAASFNRTNDNDAHRIAPQSIRESAEALGARDDVDAVFVSCTSLRVATVAEDAEAAIGKPVLASNLCLAWHCLRLGGIQDSLNGYGRLFRV